MARLGQLLVRADLVSENHLARALGIQHFAGGRLGTLLLERGSIEEDNLGKTLALQHGCEYIPWRRLAEIPLSVIAALPAKFAIKHAAVPY
jgi:type IV pilus assembly protein PilB